MGVFSLTDCSCKPCANRKEYETNFCCPCDKTSCAGNPLTVIDKSARCGPNKLWPANVSRETFWAKQASNELFLSQPEAYSILINTSFNKKCAILLKKSK